MNNNLLFSHRNQEPESSILYIVGTPIGNLEDISSRALHILEKVSLIACEDTRQTRKIMTRFGINNQLISFNKDNSFKWPETYKRVHFTIVDEKRFNDQSWELKSLTNKETYDFIK